MLFTGGNDDEENRDEKKTHANNELNAQRDQVIKRYL